MTEDPVQYTHYANEEQDMSELLVTVTLKNVLSTGKPLIMRDIPYEQAMEMIRGRNGWSITFG